MKIVPEDLKSDHADLSIDEHASPTVSADPIEPLPLEQSHAEEKKIRSTGYPRTDAGNAELFAELYGKNLRYDHKRKRWLKWERQWWGEDRTAVVYQFAKNAARYRLRLSADLGDNEEHEAEAKWALASESRHRLEAMLKLAQAEPQLADSGENWDRDPWLLGVANGVVDLQTGQLRAGKPEDRITMQTNVAFDPGAKAPIWEAFLNDIFGGDQELIDYAQRSIGYSLTGSTKEECIFNAFGTGANGKSTFLEAIRYAFGPYAGAAPFSMFEHKNKAPIPSDLASSAGKRFLTASETDESTRLNESRIKSMTGGDKQVARFLFKDFFEFEASAKIWLAFNHKPEIHDDSIGMWRRMRLVPFIRTFEPSEQDKDLKTKLRPEAEGILAWAVRGALEWQRRGLEEPKIVTDATEQYRAESDTIGNFIEECCVVGENLFVASSRLREAYEYWCDSTGAAKLDQRTFVKRLEAKGFKRARYGHDRTRGWIGIQLDESDPLANFVTANQPDRTGQPRSVEASALKRLA